VVIDRSSVEILDEAGLVDDKAAVESENLEFANLNKNSGQGIFSKETDKDLMKRIQDSYIERRLKTRPRFGYGSGPFTRDIVDVSTSWKSLSILSQDRWDKLVETLREVLNNFPASASPTRKQREKSVVQRIYTTIIITSRRGVCELSRRTCVGNEM